MPDINENTCRQSRWLLTSAVAGLLLVHAGLAVWSMRDESATFDEVSHLVAGYSYWAKNDYRLVPPHIAGRWAALPLLYGSDEPPRFDGKEWWSSNHWTVGSQWLYKSGNDADWMLLKARAMIVLLSTMLGLVVFAWSRRLFGTAGGLLSLTLYAFCPTMLAHARLVTADMATAFGFLVSVGCAWRLLHRVSWGNCITTSLAATWLVLAKPSGLAIIPIAAVLTGIRLAAGPALEFQMLRPATIVARRRQCAVLCLAAAFVVVLVVTAVWLCHGFRYAAMQDAVPGRDRFFYHDWQPSRPEGGLVHQCVRIASTYRLLPESFLYMIEVTAKTISARTAFMNGNYSSAGWTTFFPFVFLVKTPLSLLALVALLPVGAASLFRTDRAVFRKTAYAVTPLLVLFATYWLMAVTSKINIGHRHILPTYPPLLVLLGAVTHPACFGPDRRLVRIGVVALVVGFAVESALIAPHFLANFNLIVGGPKRAYRHLVDSSLDWGQDLPGLARWLAARDLLGSAQTPVYLSYFGTASPEYYGIHAKPLPGYGATIRRIHAEPLRGGVYCISATMLQGVPLDPPVWRDDLQAEFQAGRALFESYLKHRHDPAALRQALGNMPEREFKHAFERFDTLRFLKLCASLKRREPDEQIGYSILIYALSDEGVRAALDSPAAAPPR